MRVLLCLALILAVGSAAATADQLPRRTMLHPNDFEKSHDRNELLNVVGTDIFTDYLVDRAVVRTPTESSWARSGQTCNLVRSPVRAGATSIVARSGISEFLGAALESGDVARTADDTSCTLNVNALLLSQRLRGGPRAGTAVSTTPVVKGPVAGCVDSPVRRPSR